MGVDAFVQRWGETHDVCGAPGIVQEMEYSKVRNPDDDVTAVRVAVLGSAWRGLNVVAALSELQRAHPEIIRLVGVATDGVDEEGACISAPRRLWQYIPRERRESLKRWLEVITCTNGIELYTGDCKPSRRGDTHLFRDEMLPSWNPDIIISATYGQMIRPGVRKHAKWGTYNLHPSDLGGHSEHTLDRHAGGNPFNRMMEWGDVVTRMTLHHVNDVEDGGHVVASSPDIPIRNREGNFPDWTWTGEKIHPVEALHVHTSPMAGAMSVELVRAIHERRRVIDCLSMDTLPQLTELAQMVPSDEEAPDRSKAIADIIRKAWLTSSTI